MKRIVYNILKITLGPIIIAMAIFQAGQIITLPDGTKKVSTQSWQQNSSPFYEGCMELCRDKNRETNIIYVGGTMTKAEVIKNATKEIQAFNDIAEKKDNLNFIDAYYCITKNQHKAILLVKRRTNIIVDEKPTINDGTVYEKIDLRN